MKEQIKRIFAILGMFFSVPMGIINLATIDKIIISGNRDSLDIQLAIVMVVFFAICVLIINWSVKTLHIHFSLPSLKVLRNRKTLLVIGVLSIVLLIIFKEQFAIEWCCILVGNFAMLIYGAIIGAEANKNGKIRYYRSLSGLIGLPVMVYWLIVYLLLEYVIGW